MQLVRRQNPSVFWRAEQAVERLGQPADKSTSATAAPAAVAVAAAADYIKHASIKNKALQRAIDEVRQPACASQSCLLLRARVAFPWR